MSASLAKKTVSGDIFRAKDTAVGCPLQAQGDLWTSRQEAEGLKPPPKSTEDMVGSGCCSATLMKSLLVRTGTLKVLKGFPHRWAGDAGMAEDGGVAWAVPGAFLPAWGTEL